jgi:teichuronic acid biosynthesis glycosyltransferase TuaC
LRILYMIGGYGAEHLGGEIHRELALEIRSRGHDYGIFTLASSPGQASGDATEAGVPVHRAPRRAVASALDLAARPLAHCRYLVSTAHGLAAFLAAHPPFDVIVAEGAFPLGIACWWGARKRRVPYVVSVLGADFLGNETAEYGYARFRVPRALMRVAFTRAAVVRSISPYAAERAVALGCPPAKSAVVQRQIARGA